MTPETLKILFDFTDKDLLANRAGHLSARQRERLIREKTGKRVDQSARRAMYPFLIVMVVLYVVLAVPLADQYGPIVIVAAFAVIIGLSYGWWQFVRVVIRQTLTPQSLNEGYVRARSGRITFKDDGEHRAVFLGREELQTNVTVGQDERLWQIKPDEDYILYTFGSKVVAVDALEKTPFTLRFDQLRAKVHMLSPRSRMIYALNCARQVLHKYEAWALTESWAKPEILREALVLVEQSLAAETPPTECLLDLAARVDACIPHSEEFTEVSPTGAMDAGICVLCAVDCALDPTYENAFCAGEHAIVAYDISSTATVTQRDLSPEGLAEWQRQLDFIDRLVKNQ